MKTALRRFSFASGGGSSCWCVSRRRPFDQSPHDPFTETNSCESGPHDDGGVNECAKVFECQNGRRHGQVYQGGGAERAEPDSDIQTVERHNSVFWRYPADFLAPLNEGEEKGEKERRQNH